MFKTREGGEGGVKGRLNNVKKKLHYWYSKASLKHKLVRTTFHINHALLWSWWYNYYTYEDVGDVSPWWCTYSNGTVPKGRKSKENEMLRIWFWSTGDDRRDCFSSDPAISFVPMIFGIPGHGIHGNDTSPDPDPKYKVDLIWGTVYIEKLFCRRHFSGDPRLQRARPGRPPVWFNSWRGCCCLGWNAGEISWSSECVCYHCW